MTRQIISGIIIVYDYMLTGGASVGRVIFVTGFKGGVGKTTVSANIAATLHALGNKVLIVDADFGMRCMDLVLGLESDILFDCSDVLLGRCSPMAAMCDIYGMTGFSFLSAPISVPEEKIPKESFNLMFAELRDEFDYIIVDSCAEMTDYYLAFAAQADEAIVVTLHQSTAVRAAEKTASRLTALGIKEISLVVNGYRAAFAEKGKLPNIIEIINRSSVRLLGVVPYCERLQTAQEAGELAFFGDPRKKATKWESAFYNIARRITGNKINLFENCEKPKRRSAYEGIALRVLYELVEKP